MAEAFWNILVVEDNEGDFVLIREYLSESHVPSTITHRETFSQFVATVRAEEFDVVLLDLSLPDATGKDLIEDVVAHAGTTPVVILTGYLNKQFGIESLKLGAQDYLVKGEVNSSILTKAIHYSIERKRNLENLRTSNERYELVAKATNDMAWDWDLTTGQLYRSEEGWKKLFGSDREESLQSRDAFRSRVHPDDLGKAIEAIDTLLNSRNQQHFESEFRMQRDDGTYAWVIDKGYLIRDNAGHPIRLIGATQDITTRKYHESILAIEKKIYELNASPDVPFLQVLEELNKSMERLISDAYCTIVKLEENNTIRHLAGNSLPKAYYDAIEHLPIGPAAGSCGTAMYSGSAVFSPDIEADPLWASYLTATRPAGLKACWSLPIKRSDGKVIGSFATYHKTVRHPQPQEIGLVERAASLAGVLLENNNATEEIRRINERYYLVSEATNDMVWDWDLLTGSIYRSKEGWKKIFGSESAPEAEDDTAFHNRIHPDDLFRADLYLKKFFEDGPSVKFEHEFRMKRDDGSWAYVVDRGYMIRDQHGKPLRLIGATQDITESKLAELKVIDSEKRFRALIENIADGLSIIGPDRKVQFRSPSVKRILGYDDELPLGQDTTQFIHSEDRDAVVKCLDEIMAKPGASEKMEFRFRKSNGDYIWVESTFYNQLHEPSIAAVVLNYRDVTERKKQEREKELLIQELTQNNQDLKQFSFITSHNLRAPVSNLMGILELLDMSEIKSKDNLKLIEGLSTSTNQLNSIITDLVNILVIKQNANVGLEWLSLETAWKKVKDMAQGLIQEAEPDFTVNFKCAPRVFFNEIYLESILLNLLTNAIKYRSPERRLSLEIHSQEDSDFVVLSFRDNGLGIDKQKYEKRLFGLYQRFHTHADGKGIGLYMVQSQLSTLGGKIELQSTENEGTVFHVYFKKEVAGAK